MLSAVPSQREAVSCSELEGSCQLFRAIAKPSAVEGNRLMSLFFNIGSCTDVVNRVFVGQDKLKFYAPEKKFKILGLKMILNDTYYLKKITE